MGFFNWVMHGLGFEDKNGKSKKSKTAVADDKYANFNLHEPVAGENTTTTPNMVQSGLNFGLQPESNIIMVEPKNQKEIQQVVDYLRQGQTVAVNLDAISNADQDRILDFLSGAIYGLNGSIHRWYGDLFLLTPEGRKILRPDNAEDGNKWWKMFIIMVAEMLT